MFLRGRLLLKDFGSAVLWSSKTSARSFKGEGKGNNSTGVLLSTRYLQSHRSIKRMFFSKNCACMLAEK